MNSQLNYLQLGNKMGKLELKQFLQQEVKRLKQKSEEGYLHIHYYPSRDENEKHYWAALSRISVTTDDRISGSFIVSNDIPVSVEEKWKIQGYLKLASEQGIDKIPEECPYKFFEITATSERVNYKYGKGFLRLFCHEVEFHYDTFIIIREVGVPSPVYTK